MQIHISGRHLDVTQALRDYVMEKMERLERHFDRVIDAHIVMTVEKLEHKAEATLLLSGNRVHAEAKRADMYTSIDALVDKLDRQVIKYKEKIKDHRHLKETFTT